MCKPVPKKQKTRKTMYKQKLYTKTLEMTIDKINPALRKMKNGEEPGKKSSDDKQ